MFLRYISRIEINFRTKVIYIASNHFRGDPFWYVNPDNFMEGFVDSAMYQATLKELQKESVIEQDLERFSRLHAPAWKAIEHMSFGSVIKIYENLKDAELRRTIAKEYGGISSNECSNYINTLRRLRNHSAHGKVLFDMKFPKPICNSKKLKLGDRKSNPSGGYMVLKFMLGAVSEHRRDELSASMRDVLSKVDSQNVFGVIRGCSGLGGGNLL